MHGNFPILIAEDDPNDAELLRRALEQNQITTPVHFVPDGHEAIEYLEGNGRYSDRKKFPFPKVIISDLKMPRLSGFELLEWLREHPECSVVPVVLLSGSALEEDIKKAYNLGANSYFEKPPSFEQLVNVVRLASQYWGTAKIPNLDKC